MARDIFYDKDLQREFDRQGYVVVNLFGDDEAQKFLELYDSVEGAKGTANTNLNTYELSFFENDAASKKRKFERVYAYMQPYLDKVLVRYKPIIINLFNKHHGSGEVPIHQNWTFVDEDNYTSVSVWCPLQNVSRENGTLEVVPGTHKVICGYRGPSIPWVFDELNDTLKEKYMVPMELKPGQVAVIDDSVIHYSGVNQKTGERKAVQLIMKPIEATTIHCFKNADNPALVNVIDVDDDFFFDFNMWETPLSGRNLRTIQVDLHKLNEEELCARTNKNLAEVL
ncbi:MAG TPA: phytanoyl-CoA dioxygenase family protein [Chitinophagales bacterium]|nr:phytanoyl-CoA dioxygenase family protein [Chitinophagales bacterium]